MEYVGNMLFPSELQDITLYSGSIYYNITLNNVDPVSR
jgi:hypothetical protein